MLLFATLFQTADAAPYDRRLCMTMNTSFDSRVTEGDYLTDNGLVSLLGVKVVVEDQQTGAFVFQGFTEDGGTYAGCTPTLTLDDQHQYTVEVKSEADVNGYRIRAMDDLPSGFFQWDAIVDVDPSLVPKSRYFVNVPWHKYHGMVYAIGFALNRATYNVNTDALYLATDADPGNESQPGAAVYYLYTWNNGNLNGSGIAAPDPSSSLKIRPFLHEMGHRVGYLRDESRKPRFSYDANMDGCNGGDSDAPAHTFATKEYSSAAFIESFADFIPIVTFNSRGQSDCHYRLNEPLNWDLDNDTDTSGQNNAISCETHPLDLNHNGSVEEEEPSYLGDLPVASWVSGRDYLDEVVTHGPSPCGGSVVEDRGMRLDYVRFWWDMTTDEGIHPNSIATIYDWSNPRTMDRNGGGGADDPDWRLYDACVRLGYEDAWFAQANNGVNY